MDTNIPYDLAQRIANGRGVAFVGAGLSQGAGLPGWVELLQQMLKWAQIHGVALDDYTELQTYIEENKLLLVAEEMRERLGKERFRQFIAEVFRNIEITPTETHKLLPDIPFTAILTSNYDKLLETAYALERGTIPHCFTQVDFPELAAAQNNDEFYILKIHGTADRIETIVLGKKDYREVMLANSAYRQFLMAFFQNNTVLFLGYGLADPDLLLLLDELNVTFKDYGKLHYALMDETKIRPIERRRFECDYGVHIIPYTPSSQEHPEVHHFLAQLAKKVEQAQIKKDRSARPVKTIGTNEISLIDFLESMGYRIVDHRAMIDEVFFLCETKAREDIKRVLVCSLRRSPQQADIERIKQAVATYDVDKAIVLNSGSTPTLAVEASNVELFTMQQFTDRLLNLQPYLTNLIQNYEASDLAKHYIDLNSYVEGSDASRTNLRRTIFRPIDKYVDRWLQDFGHHHLSVLGDFGTGKTWFCRHYAYKQARRYLMDPSNERIPIFIALRDYAGASDIEQIVTDHLINRCQITLPAGFRTFRYLNRLGRFLLILDGFDELDRPTMGSFWELARLVEGNSKVLMTCRTQYFRHRRDEDIFLRPPPAHVSIMESESIVDLSGKEEYEVTYLMEFHDEDIRAALKRRLPADWEAAYEKIQSIYDLGSLAGRPVLLDLIVKSLPKIEATQPVNLAMLYETYIGELLRDRYKPGVSPLSPEDRRLFVTELAWDMFMQQRTSIHFSEFPQRMIAHFGLETSPEVASVFDRDIRTQLYLVRDEEGNYRFAHESFKEFLVAQRLIEELRKGKDSEQIFGTYDSTIGPRLYGRGVYRFLSALLQPGDEDVMIALLSSQYEWDRLLAAYLLGRPKVLTAKPSIILALKQRVADESDIMTRREICIALARLEIEEFIEEFVRFLKSDHALQEHVYELAYFRYHREKGGPLEEVSWRLKRRYDLPLRIEYINFMGEYATSSAISVLKLYLEDSSSMVQQETTEAILKIQQRAADTSNRKFLK